jgi:uncharacterized membrane protein YbjE (DUF340 family)
VIKYILTALTLGIISGYLIPDYSSFYSLSGLTFLYILIFIIGMAIGYNPEPIKKAFKSRSKSPLDLPVFSISGALLGGILAGLITGVPLKFSLAVAGGLGWYSLAGPMISSISPLYGALGFLSNIGREMLTYLMVPIVGERSPPEATIAMGGATAMDTTLPLITRFSGKEAVLWGLYNGFVLSLAAPVLIGIFLTT